jgi:SAM-dependent MidA family methyltransferase
MSIAFQSFTGTGRCRTLRGLEQQTPTGHARASPRHAEATPGVGARGVTAPPAPPRPWRAAAAAALYGPGGFFSRPEGPGGHFRTSVTATPLFAAAVRRLAGEVDELLGRPDPFDIVDVGAGRGELLRALLDAGVPARWRLTGVELAARPADLPEQVRWSTELPPLTGLLVANEWLDDVPVDVVAVSDDGPRLLLVDDVGVETPGGPPSPRDLAWLETWWSLDDALPGDRAEIGHPRDDAWLIAVDAVRRGVAVAVDYASRRGARPRSGSLTGYRDGRPVTPVPDGSCDITASVALDACAAAGVAAGADETLLTPQWRALTALGLSPERPPRDVAGSDPPAYLAGLAAASSAVELLDPAGLGGFSWLVQTVACRLPAALDALPAGSDTERDLALPHS